MRTPTADGGGACFAPALGVSFEGRPADFLPAVADLADVVEIVPDSLVAADQRPHPALLEHLDEHAANHPVTFHGIGLSIGSTQGWNEDYLRLLDAMLTWRMPRWHSEHLGLTVVDGSFLGTMPALPLTSEAAELVIGRAQAMRAAYGLDFLLEHVASPLPRPDQMSLAAFLNLVAAESGASLLIDLHNLECDADNGLLDLGEFVDELDWSAVRELHLAGGVWHEGLHLDVHSGLVATSTSDLLHDVLPRAAGLELVVYEVLAEAVPKLGVDAIGDQLGALRALLNSDRLVAP